MSASSVPGSPLPDSQHIPEQLHIPNQADLSLSELTLEGEVGERSVTPTFTQGQRPIIGPSADQEPSSTQHLSPDIEAAQQAASQNGGLSPTSPRPSPSAALLLSPPKSPMALPTRTVAILKNHALDHRFDIEARITEAQFEIVKERQMEFDVETDPDTLFELFGDDAASFAEGPVWVYVLERRRAIEVWHTIMGDPNPSVARKLSPHSLRALYGLSPEQNAVMGSPDAATAEIQIASLFASSPPFPATEDFSGDITDPTLLDLNGGSMRSITSSVASALRRDSTSRSGASATPPGVVRTSSGGFKARAIPSTHDKPSIAPRSSRAADLRAGIITESNDRKVRVAPTKEALKQMFMDVPGHKRSGSIAVASTAPPALAPRMTRAAALRLGQTPVESPSKARRQSLDMAANKEKTDLKAMFEGIPGHKRRESIAVASTKAPTMAPRLNKSAALRAQKDAERAPPSSFMFREHSSRSLSRSSSQNDLGASTSRPASSQSQVRSTPSASSVSTPPVVRRATSRTSTTTPAASLSQSQNRPPASRTSTQPRVSAASTPTSEKSLAVNGSNGAAASPSPAKPRPRPSSLQAPTMAPRQNKSAMLRAAKMAAQQNGGKPVKV